MPTHHPTRLAAALPLLVTMGDASGIGPEIIAKAAAEGELDDAVVVGDVGVLRRAVAACGLALPVAVLDHPADLRLPARRAGRVPPAGLARGLGDVAVRGDRCARRRRRGALHRAGRRVDGRGRGARHRHRADPQGGAVGRRRAFPGHTEMLQALAAAPGGRRRRCA